MSKEGIAQASLTGKPLSGQCREGSAVGGVGDQGSHRGAGIPVLEEIGSQALGKSTDWKRSLNVVVVSPLGAGRNTGLCQC